MKLQCSNRRNAGFNFFEVGIVVAIIIVLAVVLLPGIGRHKMSSAPRIMCVNNLKQIGLAYRVWEGDNNDFFPMGISVTNGGSMEQVATGSVTGTFQVMSNELSTPRILICPADPARHATTGFVPLYNYNVSYLVGVDTTNDTPPLLILSGDGNFELGGKWVGSGLQSFGTNDPITWSANRHVHAGNIGFADGSVMQFNDAGLTNALATTGLATNRLALP